MNNGPRCDFAVRAVVKTFFILSRNRFRLFPSHPGNHHQPRQHQRAEIRRHHPDAHRHREAFNRPRAERKQNQRCDQRR